MGTFGFRSNVSRINDHLIRSLIKQRRSSGLQKGREQAAHRRGMPSRVTGLGLRLCVLMCPQVITVFNPINDHLSLFPLCATDVFMGLLTTAYRHVSMVCRSRAACGRVEAALASADRGAELDPPVLQAPLFTRLYARLPGGFHLHSELLA